MVSMRRATVPHILLKTMCVGFVVTIVCVLVGAANVKEVLGATVRWGEEVRLSEISTIAGNLYLVGLRNAQAQGRIAGDAVVVGEEEASVEEGAVVDGDVVLVGRVVRASGTTTGDVRAMGWNARIDGKVGGDVAVLGMGRIVVSEGAQVSGDVVAWSGWGEVEVEGTVAGDMYLYAPRVVLAGVAHGTTTVRAPVIEVREGAKIAVLRHPEGARVVVAEGAEVHKTVALPADGGWQGSWWRWLGMVAGVVVGMVLTMAIATRLAAPRIVEKTWRAVRQRFVWYVALGTLVVFGAVPFVVSLLVSGVGLFVGMAALGLLFFAFAVAAGLVGVAGGALLTARLAQSVDPLDWQWFLVFAGLGAFFLFIPLVGWVLWFVFWVATVGAIVEYLWDRR